MPFAHIVERENKLVIVRGSGAGSIAETKDSLDRLLADASLGREYLFMFVVSDIELTPVVNEFYEIVSFLRTLKAKFPGRKAIVNSAQSRNIPVKLLTMLIDPSRQTFHDFSTESEARQWLLTNATD